jgi:hypothetical protein
MKKDKTKPSAKAATKASVRKPDSQEARKDAPSKKEPEKTDNKRERSHENPGATAGVPITNQDAQETITNESSGQTTTPDAKSPEQEDHQGERMGPAYIDDDSEILREESEQITPET